MRIGSSTPGQGYFAGGAGSKPVSGSDAYSKNIEEQIRNAEKKLQDLSKDDKIPPDERMKKQQEIRKEITELQTELRQHEMEIRQEERQQKASGTSMEDMLGGETQVRGKGEKKGTGFSDAGMKAMISADASIKQADIQGSVKTTMEGKAGVLESEIKLDKARGADTAKKEEELADLQAGVSGLTSGQLKTLSAANKEMEKAEEEEAATEGSATTKEKKLDQRVKEAAENGTVNTDDEQKSGTEEKISEPGEVVGILSDSSEVAQSRDGLPRTEFGGSNVDVRI